MTAKIRAVLLDIDGTLWDSRQVIAAAWNEVFRARPESASVCLRIEDVNALMGHTGEEIAEMLFPGLSRELHRLIMDECSETELTALEKQSGVFYPGVIETIRALRARGLFLGVVSNCQDGYIERMEKSGGLEELISDGECSGRTGRPKGENILTLLSRNGLSPEEAVYVGDTEMDEAACRLAGVRFVYASYGFGQAASPDAVISDFPSLLSLPGLPDSANG